MIGWVEYGVVDDYGDDWENGDIVFSSRSLDKCLDWAESENYHSASIVRINTMLGERERVG